MGLVVPLIVVNFPSEYSEIGQATTSITECSCVVTDEPFEDW